jgi:uncharacterized membrane protein YcaP (DUF421 family)
VDVQALLLTSGRAVAVYVLMLVVVRVLGKRTIGNFSAFDLLVALMLGEVVDEMIYGDVRFIQGTVAIVTIGAVAYFDSLLSFWNRGMEGLLEGKPTLVIKRGEFHRPGMRQERMSEHDVLGALRSQGVRDLREVEYAAVEHDGTLSVMPFEWAQPAIKADIDPDMAKARQAAIGGQGEPPAHKRTDSAAGFGIDAAELR